MAQTGYTPILIYSSSTTTNAPAAGNLTNSTLGSELAINITDGKLFYKDNANAIQVIGWKVVPATAGGTGQTVYAVGDLLYANTTTSLAKLADVATGNALISGGVGVAPAWGKIGLTTHVSGVLPTANGGTNLSSFTANGVLYASSTSALATGSALTFDGTNFATTGSATVKNLLLTGGTLPAVNTPSIALRSSDNTIYYQSGSANTHVFLDKDQNTMAIIDKTNGVSVSGANFVVGTSGNGIDFSATPGTGTSELFADYEEGAWTPVIADASTGGNTGSFSGSATYTKIGRQVTVRMYISAINTTGMTAGNTLFIRGLPYAAASTTQGSFYTYRVGRDASTVSSCANIGGAGSYFNFALFTTNSATADKTILVSDIVSGTSEIQTTLTYFV
jgi:hypothetical protein